MIIQWVSKMEEDMWEVIWMPDKFISSHITKIMYIANAHLPHLLTLPSSGVSITWIIKRSIFIRQLQTKQTLISLHASMPSALTPGTSIILLY